MKRGLAGMIYLSYICTRNSAKGELSSAGSERLPYKQRVGGSNPSAPTTETIQNRMVFYAGSIASWFRAPARQAGGQRFKSACSHKQKSLSDSFRKAFLSTLRQCRSRKRRIRRYPSFIYYETGPCYLPVACSRLLPG